MMTEVPNMAVMNAQEMPAEVPAPAPAQEPTQGSFHQDSLENYHCVSQLI